MVFKIYDVCFFLKILKPQIKVEGRFWIKEPVGVVVNADFSSDVGPGTVNDWFRENPVIFGSNNRLLEPNNSCNKYDV